MTSHTQVAAAPLPEHFKPAPHAAPVDPQTHAPPTQTLALATPFALVGQVVPLPLPHWQVFVALQVSVGVLPLVHWAQVPPAPQLATDAVVTHAVPATLQQPPSAPHAAASHVQVAALPLPVHLRPVPQAAPVAPQTQILELQRFAL